MGCITSKVDADQLYKDKQTTAKPPAVRRTFRKGSDLPIEVRRISGAADRQKVLTLLNSSVEKDLLKLENKPVQKALFLGTGESGKSTVFKQMRLCYDNSFSDFERQQYSKLIWVDTLRSIRTLVDMCDEERHLPGGSRALRAMVTGWLGDPKLNTDPHKLEQYVQLIQSLNLTREAFLETEIDVDARAFLHNHVAPKYESRAAEKEMAYGYSPVKDTNSESNDNLILSSAFAGQMVKISEPSMDQLTTAPRDLAPTRANITEATVQLWKHCPTTIKQLVVANQLGLETNAAYFLDKIADLRDPLYLATDEDILHARIKTTGITTAEFNVKSNNLLVMDVGGQRSERRKWIHSFDDVTCILFVASVSEYDQGLEEQKSVNRLDEALEVFDQTVNSQWFRAKSVQLFLNKIDILEQKCRCSSFKAHFPQYTGNDTNPEEITSFIESMFRERFRTGSRNLYVHRTCATDTTTMKFVINAVSDMILFENLKWAGMV